jgi:8-oxo-dGTP pyrophosphatase MutT (NUDIX family)
MNENAPPAAPRRAATIMLLREGNGGLEVLMTRRHENLAFMGGLWVFPGGTLRPPDSSPRTLAGISDKSRAPCLQFSTLHGHVLDREECLGLAVAACRETFEETGVLLAVDADGQSCSIETFSRLQAERTAVAAQPEQFAIMLEREQLLLDVGRLVYWAHWITPSTIARRFDTRFFAVAIGPDQTITADTTETIECLWMSPAALVDLAARAEMPIAQPTLYNLIDLRDSYSRHGSLQELLTSEMQRTVPPILPKMIHEESHATIVMPWDEGYARLAGESAPADIVYSPLLRAQPSRLVMRRR